MKGSFLYDNPMRANIGVRIAKREGFPEMLPLFDAVRARSIAVLFWGRSDRPFPDASLAKITVPTLVVLQDVVGADAGPGRWPLAEITGWADRKAFAYGCMMDADFYRLAVETTLEFGRFMLVQTEMEMVPAWQRAMGGRIARPQAVGVS